MTIAPYYYLIKTLMSHFFTRSKAVCIAQCIALHFLQKYYASLYYKHLQT